MYSSTILQQPPTWQHYLLFCVLACVFRLILFFGYIQHNERYQQPDSGDYHTSAWLIRQGLGMHTPQKRPLFWRTPGYPACLSLFYDKNIKTSTFTLHTATHKKIMVAQILFCSSLPWLAGILAMTLTGIPLVAWISALVSTVHIGAALASTFLLTDAIASVIFVLFLILLFHIGHFCHQHVFFPNPRYPCIIAILAACTLAAYTWLRPMGQFMGIFSTLLLLFGHGSWRQTILRSCLFFLIFSALLFPWFLRNYRITQSWFFCPLFGLYLNVFNAPKIFARTAKIPLEDAHKKLSYAAAVLAARELKALRASGDTTHTVCPENIAFKTAWPFVRTHPGYFLYDWMTEVTKTSFDLYSYQLVSLHHNCFKWDPLIEFLPNKITECLYKKELPFLFRLTAWFEFLGSLILWAGMIIGFFVFVLHAAYQKNHALFARYGYLWIWTGLWIGLVIMQTGGFGYARLRLPIEPLMLILGTTFWVWFLDRYFSHGISICPVAYTVSHTK